MYELMQEGIVLVLLLSCVPIGVVAVSSGLFATVQAMTQIQEPSVMHLIKVVTCAGVLYLGGVPAFQMTVQLLHRAFALIEVLGRPIS